MSTLSLIKRIAGVNDCRERIKKTDKKNKKAAYLAGNEKEDWEYIVSHEKKT